jgi:hypothetical protein
VGETNLKLGTQCNTYGRWFHNSCANVTVQVAGSRKWICDKCRSERIRLLEERLQNALLQIGNLSRKNKVLEEQLHLETAGREVGRQHTVLGDRKGGECLSVG